MSLKAFHVLFIVSSILLCFGFGAWELHARTHTGSLVDLALGLGSLVSGVVLLFYFKAMLRKLRDISYL